MGRPPTARSSTPRGASPRAQAPRARPIPIVPKPRGPRWWSRAAKRALVLWQRLLERPAPWVGALLLLGGLALLPRGLFLDDPVIVGEIAARDYTASRDLLLPDEESTRRREERARAEVQPVYDFDPGPLVEAALASAFEAGRERLAQGARFGTEAEAQALAAELRAERAFELSPEITRLLARKGFNAGLEERLRGLAAQVERRGVVLSKDSLLEHRDGGVRLRNLRTGAERELVDLYNFLGYSREVAELVDSELRGWEGVGPSERRLLAAFLVANLKPNLHFNQSETLRRQDEAAVVVGPSFSKVRRGQVIVRKGDELSAWSVRAIQEMRRGAEPGLDRLLPYLGGLGLLAGLAWLVWLVLADAASGSAQRPRFFAAVLLILGLSLLAARLNLLLAEGLGNLLQTAPFDSPEAFALAVPFAAPALLAALLLGRPIAFLLALCFCLVVGRLAVGDAEPWSLSVFGLAGSLAGVLAVERYQVKPRLVMTRLGLVVSAINAGVILVLSALGALGPVGWSALALSLACGVLGGLLVAAVLSFALPIFEATLGLTTDIRLAELSNTNLPLLRRLAFEAPGTFQHSLMVAHLAKQAAEAIGADAALAYAAGLYHDIGKMVRPEYFVENQRGGVNPHDKIQPTMSSQILVRHIKDGAALAREQHLPQPLIDAIQQHHGTRLIKYFYNRALERQADMAPTESQFRYPGPRPQDKVMGLLMLADAVEAASRTLVEPSHSKIRTLIRTIVDDCLSDGQLEETDLTLADLRIVAERFLEELATVFHQRIDYPGFDFNRDARSRDASPSRPALAPVTRRAS
jgi:cyclic-di-AMP phosphodiesterase PgpH